MSVVTLRLCGVLAPLKCCYQAITLIENSTLLVQEQVSPATPPRLMVLIGREPKGEGPCAQSPSVSFSSSVVALGVAVRAERDQVLFGVVARVAAELSVMYL